LIDPVDPLSFGISPSAVDVHLNLIDLEFFVVLPKYRFSSILNQHCYIKKKHENKTEQNKKDNFLKLKVAFFNHPLCE